MKKSKCKNCAYKLERMPVEYIIKKWFKILGWNDLQHTTNGE